jgi:hypothetical protein
MTTALGCLARLIVLAVITTAVDHATAASLPEALRPWTALVAGMLITLGLSNVWSLLRGYGQGESSRRALLSRAQAGQPPSQDGPILATGVVRAEGPALVSPVTGQSCVAYQYRIYERVLVTNAQRETRVHYWGYACRPFRLDTASQTLRVLGMPRFVEEPTRHENEPDARTRTEGYLRTTRFETSSAPAAAVAVAWELFTENRQEIRRDWQRTGAPLDLSGLRIEEEVLPVNARASAWGRWSSEQRGIVPGGLGSESPTIVMVQGPPQDLLSGAAGLPSSAIAVAIAAVLLLGLGGGLVWAARAGYVAEMWAW